MRRRPPLYLASLSPVLVARLENWADAYRDRQRQDVSATGRFCDQLARRAKGEGVMEAARQPRPEILERDAFLVEKAMHQVSRRPRQILCVHYLWKVYPWRLRSNIRGKLWDVMGFAVRMSEWETEIVRSHWPIENLLASVGRKVYNPRDNSNGLAPLVHTTGVVRLKKAEPKRSAFALLGVE